MKAVEEARPGGRGQTKMRDLLAAVLILGLLVSACASSSDQDGPSETGSSQDESATDDSSPADDFGDAGDRDDEVDTTQGADEQDSDFATLEDLAERIAPPVEFVSSDGTAFAGSRSVLRLRHVESGVSQLVSVEGEAEATKQRLVLEPGTYEVETTGRQVAPTASYEVVSVTPDQFVVPESTDGEPGPTTIVEFSVDAQSSSFDLALDEVTADRIDLVWEALGDAQIAAYELVLTFGADAAASPLDGAAMEIAPDGVSASVDQLDPATEYTFTLFATDVDGRPLEFRSVTVTTASADGDEPSYALAPNTIVATDFSALQPESIAPDRIQLTLEPGATDRTSLTEIPGVANADAMSGCVVGTPFLASTEVAGDNAFYGLIESCSPAPAAWRAMQGDTATTVVVNADVPLAAVVPFFHLVDAQVNRCIGDDGLPLGPDAELCQPSPESDTDGDGVTDEAEVALGLDPQDSDDNFDTWVAEIDAEPSGRAIDVDELVAPIDLGTGNVQVTLLWSTADDLDLYVTEPDGTELFYNQPTSESGGRLDRDDEGDETCRDPSARAENVFWDENAPVGTYTVRVENFTGGSRQACNANPVAKLQIRVGGVLIDEQVITVGETAPITFEVSETSQVLPVDGELEVTVTWSGPNDLSIALASGFFAMLSEGPDQEADFEVPTDAGPIVVQGFSGDPTCASTATHTETIVWDGAPPGDYLVSVGHLDSLCGVSTNATIDIRVRGESIISEALVVTTQELSETNEFFTFTIPEGPEPGDSWQSSAAAAGFAAAPTVSCERKSVVIPVNGELGVGDDADFFPSFGFDEFHKVDVTVKGGTLRWDIDAGVTAYVSPSIKIEGGVECSLDLPSATFQLTTTPVPVNLELAPIVQGGATGSFKLSGPKLELTFGVHTDGFVDASFDTCGWFEIPCGIDVDTGVNANPITGFTIGEASMEVEGELTLGVGVEATLGIGVKNSFVTAKTGFAVTMQPAVAKLKAALSSDLTPAPVDLTRALVPFDNDVWNERQQGHYLETDPDELECPFPGQFLKLHTLVRSDSSIVRYYICADAYCLDTLSPTFTGRFTGRQELDCQNAKCLSNDEVIDGTSTACPMFADPEAQPASANPFSLCAQVALGYELSVDLRAETFVLGWGVDKRYPVYKGEGTYTQASLGECG